MKRRLTACLYNRGNHLVVQLRPYGVVNSSMSYRCSATCGLTERHLVPLDSLNNAIFHCGYPRCVDCLFLFIRIILVISSLGTVINVMSSRSLISLALPDSFFVNFSGRPIWSGLATVTVRPVAILVRSSLLLPCQWLRHWV